MSNQQEKYILGVNYSFKNASDKYIVKNNTIELSKAWAINRKRGERLLYRRGTHAARHGNDAARGKLTQHVTTWEMEGM